MHELLLFGQVPSSRHSQVLSILAGIAAMQPQPYIEKRLIFKPTESAPGTTARSAPSTGTVQGVSASQVQALQAQTQGDVFYLQLVADIEGGEGEKGREAGGEDRDGVKEEERGEVINTRPPNPASTPLDEPPEPYESSAENWTLQFRDLPEVGGRRPVTSRLIHDLKLRSADPIAFMSALDYNYTSTHIIHGHRLSHLSTSLLLFRPSVPLPHSPSSSPLPSNAHLASHTRLLDPSGSYILQAALRVQDGAKPELMNRGIRELLALKGALKGVVEMAVVERLGLDSRVR